MAQMRSLDDEYLPYGRQLIDDEDVAAVAEVLRSDWLTTGPAVEAFEKAVAEKVGAAYGVAVANGTAALHSAMFALGVAPGDEVIVPAMTFVATANAVVYMGGVPKIVDVAPQTLLINPQAVEASVTPRTKGIVAVDYAGQPCDYRALRQIADRHGLFLLADACHSLGGAYRGRPVGSLAHATVFSFHPVKHITTGEGGMVVTSDPELCARARVFRNHGIDLDARQREEAGAFAYAMRFLGCNYRLTDIQSALGLSQLRKLDGFVAKRRELAQLYDEALTQVDGVSPLRTLPEALHARHLYVVRLGVQASGPDRQTIFERMRGAKVGVNVHYLPVHLHPWYLEWMGTSRGMCPVAEQAYESVLSLPLHPAMGSGDIRRVVDELATAMS